MPKFARARNTGPRPPLYLSSVLNGVSGPPRSGEFPNCVGEYDTRLLQALRATRVGAWSIDFVDDRRVWSQECAELLGLPHDAILDHERLLNSIHPEDRERVRELAQGALAQGAGFESDCRVVWPDASEHWVFVKGCIHRDAAGRPDRLEGVVQDIAGRKRLETELRESQRELSSLISHLPGVVYRWQNDAQWSVDFVSDGIAAMTGYSRSDLEQRSITFNELTHPQDRQRVRSAVDAALANREAYQLIYRIVTKSGEEKWVWEQGTGVFSPANELQFLEGVMFDITRHRRAELDNARLEGRLRQAQKMEALGTLAGGIAHDFNNVLAAIRGNADLAIADLPPDSPALVSINEIKRSAARAADLVRQILAFSRQEGAERRPIALQTAVAEVIRLLRATLPALIEIHTSFAPRMPSILADATQIHQVIMNLGVNAAQAIGERAGVIEFRLDCVTMPMRPGHAIAELPPGRYVRLSVSDTGCGMDQATLERIYDPFFTTKPAGRGTGLGLSVVHGIMQSHEGAISIDSAPGRGSTFCLYFPVAREVASADPLAAAPARQGHGQHILYVDDEEALVFLAQRSLQRLGYRITVSTDPLQALEIFRAGPAQFDCVVTDLSMPGMSGPDLARELLKIRPDLPIVLTSGHVRPQDVQTAQRIGIRDVMRKPGTIDELARVLDDILRERTMPRSTPDAQ